MKNLRNISLLGWAIVGILMCMFATGCSKAIPPSSVGIVFHGSSGIQEEVKQPGIRYVGWNDRLIVYPTSQQNIAFVKNAKEGDREGDDSIWASTSEGAQLPLDITVIVHVDPNDTVTIFKKFGAEDFEDILKDTVRYPTIAAVNEVSGKLSIFAITSTDRANFGPQVKTLLAPKLKKFGLTVDDVLLGETWQADEIKKLVDQKIAASSELQTVTNNLAQEKIKAQTLVNNAKGNADINRLKSEQGAEANAIRKRNIQAILIKKWDGEVPVVGDGSIPFINPNVLKPDVPTPGK